MARKGYFYSKGGGGNRATGRPPEQILPPAVLPAKTPTGHWTNPSAFHLQAFQLSGLLWACKRWCFCFFLRSAVCFPFYETGCLIPGVVSWLLRLPRLGTPTRQQRQRYFTPADYLVQSAEKSIFLFPNKARDNRWKTAFLPVNISTGISNLWELRRHLANIYFLRAQALFLLSLEMHLCCWDS